MSLKKPEPLLQSSQAESLLYTTDSSNATVKLNKPWAFPQTVNFMRASAVCILFLFTTAYLALNRHGHSLNTGHTNDLTSFLPLGFCSNPLPTSHRPDITAQPDFQLTNYENLKVHVKGKIRWTNETLCNPEPVFLAILLCNKQNSHRTETRR